MLGLFASNNRGFLGSRFVRSGLLFLYTYHKFPPPYKNICYICYKEISQRG